MRCSGIRGYLRYALMRRSPAPHRAPSSIRVLIDTDIEQGAAIERVFAPGTTIPLPANCLQVWGNSPYTSSCLVCTEVDLSLATRANGELGGNVQRSACCVQPGEVHAHALQVMVPTSILFDILKGSDAGAHPARLGSRPRKRSRGLARDERCVELKPASEIRREPTPAAPDFVRVPRFYPRFQCGSDLAGRRSFHF